MYVELGLSLLFTFYSRSLRSKLTPHKKNSTNDFKSLDSYLTLYSRYKHYKVEADNFMTGQYLSKNRLYP